MALPDAGLPFDELLTEVRAGRAGDRDWRSGRVFSLVYNADDAALERVLHAVFDEYLHENALNPSAFPSLRRMERDVIEWTCGLFGHAGPKPVGSLTSGGTDSIFLAVKVARDHARAVRAIAEPTLVIPTTAHPAFDKAAHHLDVELVRVPLGSDGRVDVAAMSRLIDDRTAMVVASAPCYPYGLIDDVPAVAALAGATGVLCHVDACLGGFLLPFWERIGRKTPPWDFRVEGVTSISADVHKYGYTFKGASVLAFRDRSLLDLQWFFSDAWPGGMYGSPGTAGTRPAPPIAGAWAAMRHLGLGGYDAKARVLAGAIDRLVAGVGAVDGLRVTYPPDLATFEISSDQSSSSGGLDVGAVGDVLGERGWHVDRQQGGLHLIVSPIHARVADDFLADLGEAAAAVRAGRSAAGAAAAYGDAGPA